MADHRVTPIRSEDPAPIDIKGEAEAVIDVDGY